MSGNSPTSFEQRCAIDADTELVGIVPYDIARTSNTRQSRQRRMFSEHRCSVVDHTVSELSTTGGPMRAPWASCGQKLKADPAQPVYLIIDTGVGSACSSTGCRSVLLTVTRALP